MASPFRETEAMRDGSDAVSDWPLLNALVNTGRKLPVIHDVSCVNGNFIDGTCFAEGWMRASEGALPTGAVAIYASAIIQYFDPPMVAQDEAVDVLVDETSRSFGGICGGPTGSSLSRTLVRSCARDEKRGAPHPLHRLRSISIPSGPASSTTSST